MLGFLLACHPSATLDTSGATSKPRPDELAPVDHEAVTADWTVDCTGGGDFLTITEAITAAKSGQFIDVKACTYAENIDFVGKSLTLRARGAVEDTVIAAPGGSVVTAVSGEGEGTAVIGFTLSGGSASAGSAVYLDFSAIRLEDDVITGNRGSAIVYGVSADIEMKNVSFQDNNLRGGVVVYVDRGGLTVDHTSLACDNGSYGLYASHGSAYVDSSTFACPGAYATYWEHTVGLLKRSRVDGSVAISSETDHYDDAMAIQNSFVRGKISANYGSMTITNSVVEGEVVLTNTYSLSTIEGSVLTGASCAISGTLVVIDEDTADTAAGVMSEPFVVRNNIFWGVPRSNCSGDEYVGLDGNLAVDPLFTDWAAGDWHLAAGSPAVNAGPPESSHDDIDGTRNDIGVYGGHGSLDGGW
ncbi:MAG: hypothetical protein EXR69_06295 [Myxococcales bacterium]|nr:hypothetical protein [Myxococcales bacterium]